jgi:hypothetical protein
MRDFEQLAGEGILLAGNALESLRGQRVELGGGLEGLAGGLDDGVDIEGRVGHGGILCWLRLASGARLHGQRV